MSRKVPAAEITAAGGLLLGDKRKVRGAGWGGGIHAHKERSWELNKSENGIMGR